MAGSAGGDGSGRGGRDARCSGRSRPVPETWADTIGLTLAEGRSTLAGLNACCRSRRPTCQGARTLSSTTRRRGDRRNPFSTATTESAVQRLIQRRMNAKQQMRWSPKGAHLMLKVRTAVMNATFERDHVTAERWANRPYRRPA